MHSFKQILSFLELLLHSVDIVLHSVKINRFVILVDDASQFLIEVVVQLIYLGCLLADEPLPLISHML